MKNKFKKSKIIVPALALITTTTVASVTGTVAWFTAARTVSVNVTSFKTTTLNSNLLVKVEGLNTGIVTDDTTATNSKTIKFEDFMTHGSYDAKTLNNGSSESSESNDSNDSSDTSSTKGKTQGNLYTPIMDSYAVTGYVSKGTVENQHKTSGSGTDSTTDAWKAGKTSENEGKDVWYAVAWKMTFSAENIGNGVINTVHFDPATTTFTDSNTKGDTIKGLRVALMSESNFYVAAGDAQKTHVAKDTNIRFEYVEITKNDSTKWKADTYFPASGNNKAYTETEFNQLANGTNIYTRKISDGVESSYEDANFVDVSSKTSMTYPADGAADSLKTTSNYYLGDITANSTLTVIAVAWFEGTDTNIVSMKDASTATVMSNVTANLQFFSRTVSA